MLIYLLYHISQKKSTKTRFKVAFVNFLTDIYILLNYSNVVVYFHLIGREVTAFASYIWIAIASLAVTPFPCS